MFNRKTLSSTEYSSSNLYTRITSSETYIITTVSFGLLVDMATYGIMVPVLPFRLRDIGYHKVAAASSYLIAAFALGLIISSIPISILGELIKKWRIPLKFPLLVCLLFLCGSLILFWFSTSFPVLVLARILQGVSGTGIWTLGLALICEVVPEKRIGAVMGYVMIGWSIGTIIGPLAGGLLYDSLGYHSIFVFALILAAIDFTLRLLVSDKKAIQARQALDAFDKDFNHSVSANPESSSQKDVEEKARDSDDVNHAQYTSLPTRVPSTAGALWSLLFNPRVWTLFSIVFILGFAFGGLLDSGMTLLVHSRYGLNPRGAGLVFIGAVVPSFASSPLAGHFADKYGAKWPTLVCLIIGTPFFGLMSLGGSLPTFIVWLAMTGLFVMAIAAPIMQDLAEIVMVTPGLGYAHVYGIFNMIYSAGSLIGPLCVGASLEHLGIEAGWRLVSIICALLCALSVVPVWLFVPNKKPVQTKMPLDEPGCEDFTATHSPHSPSEQPLSV